MIELPERLGDLTTEQARLVVEGEQPTVVLLPVGSTEPHGPHLPLSTDVLISLEACARATPVLRGKGIATFVAPALPYGVTEYAQGFAGAVSLSADLVTRLVGELCRSFLQDGWRHVSVVNNHLEPGHVAALHAAVVGVNETGSGGEIVPVSFPNVLSRRWGRTLTDEFRSGACHAGQYEGSLVLATRPDLVDEARMSALAPNPISLSEAIEAGKKTFLEIGGPDAYFGDPAAATAAEGQETYERLSAMIVTEVTEALGF